MTETTLQGTTAEPTRGMTAEQIRQFGEEGYAGPFTLCSPEEMAHIRERIEREALTGQTPLPVHYLKDRYLDCQVIYDLCSHPALCAVMESVCGPDLLLFATAMFAKEPGFPEFPWHCDGPYWPMLPSLGVTAWIAIDDATLENGCVSVIPRSHRTLVRHTSFGYGPWHWLRRKFGHKKLQGQRAVVSDEQVASAVSMELQPGQFFVFTQDTVHNAGPNRTNQRRAGLAARVTVPLVRIRHDDFYPEHKAALIHGEDRFGWNRLADRPE